MDCRNSQARTLGELQSIKALIARPTWQERSINTTDIVREKTMKRQRPCGPYRFISTHSSGKLLKTLGMTGSVVCSRSDLSTVYSFSVRSHIPFASILGENVLALDFSLRSFPLCRSISVQENSILAIRTVVPHDAEIMTACVKGDLQRVVRLFVHGKARPDDVTPLNSTPLRVNVPLSY